MAYPFKNNPTKKNYPNPNKKKPTQIKINPPHPNQIKSQFFTLWRMVLQLDLRISRIFTDYLAYVNLSFPFFYSYRFSLSSPLSETHAHISLLFHQKFFNSFTLSHLSLWKRRRLSKEDRLGYSRSGFG
jgi:hypothetical protein